MGVLSLTSVLLNACIGKKHVTSQWQEALPAQLEAFWVFCISVVASRNKNNSFIRESKEEELEWESYQTANQTPGE